MQVMSEQATTLSDGIDPTVGDFTTSMIEQITKAAQEVESRPDSSQIPLTMVQLRFED